MNNIYRLHPQTEMRFDGLWGDLFAGHGGASEGYFLQTGRQPDFAANHNPVAIGVHQVNHPQTHHLCADVRALHPLEVTRGQRMRGLWLSPDCRHFSRSRGKAPVSKRIRSLAWEAAHWGATAQPDMMYLENVPEFLSWGPIIQNDRGEWVPDKRRAGKHFNSFTKELRRLGYDLGWKELLAADFGVPQTRRRLFMVMRRDGQQICWPEPTHGAPDSEGVRSGLLKPWRTAAECIDWSLPAPSVFDRARPLVDASAARITNGTYRYVINSESPFLLKGESLRKHLAANGTPSNRNQQVAAWLAKNYTGVVGQDLRQPMSTVTRRDHHALVTVAMEPVPAAPDQVAAFLVRYYSTGGQLSSLSQPMPTITSKARIGLVIVEGRAHYITDIRYRMLKPHELKIAMGFGPDYVIDRLPDGTRIPEDAQTAGLGNAVPPQLAAALIGANLHGNQWRAAA
jgi:DNA (cytosine-5)-methyltransferase 1